MSFVEDSNKRAREHAMEMEIERIIRQAELAGIPEGCMTATPDDIERLLNLEVLSRDAGCVGEEIAKTLCLQGDWARQPTFVVVDGATPAKRMEIAHICMMKALVANVQHEGRTAMKVDIVQLLPLLNSFESERFHKVRELSEVPVLLISEIRPPNDVRIKNDMPDILDWLIVERQDRSFPTILTTTTTDLPAYGKGSGYGQKLGYVLCKVCTPSENIYRLTLA